MREDGHGGVEADKVERLALRTIAGDGVRWQHGELRADDRRVGAVYPHCDARRVCAGDAAHL